MPVALSRFNIRSGSAALQVLCVEAPDVTVNSPVLLFLHGKMEFGLTADYLPMVLRNMAPGFQVMQERLREVTVVSPQCPSSTDDWNWRTHLIAISQELPRRFSGRQILATGFSRGARGVLQLNAVSPRLISRWAIVDPQRAEDEEEQTNILPKGPRAPGWLRFGNQFEKNTPFAKAVQAQLDPDHAVFHDLKHGEIAQAAYGGHALGGTQDMYEYLGITFKKPEKIFN